MIPKSYIIEWSESVPWADPRQIEQDLIITTALIKLYSHDNLKKALAFRGGTALNKLIFNPPSRYSEDIDLVQIAAQPIGPIITTIREVMDLWLGEPKRTFSNGLATLIYKTLSEEGFPIKLKIEINTREHFSVLGFHDYIFSSNSTYYPGSTIIKAYKQEELLGTKMRALYQRRKGRDLYDLYIALTTIEHIDIKEIIACFNEYTQKLEQRITKEHFITNLEAKLLNNEFRKDITPLLPRHKNSFDPDIAFEYIRDNLIYHL